MIAITHCHGTSQLHTSRVRCLHSLKPLALGCVNHNLHLGMQPIFNKCKNIFTKMLKDVGIEVPKGRETRSKCSMHVEG